MNCKFTKKKLCHRCFPANFPNIFKIAIFASKKCISPQTLFVLYVKTVKLQPITKKSFHQSLEKQSVMKITKKWALFPGLVNLVPLLRIKLVHLYMKKTLLPTFVYVLLNKIWRSFF